MTEPAAFVQGFDGSVEVHDVTDWGFFVLNCRNCATSVKLRNLSRWIMEYPPEGWTFSSLNGWYCPECS